MVPSPKKRALAGNVRAMSDRQWPTIPCRSSSPCHRVLAAGGKTGGFSAPGGVDTKLKMLTLEGVDPTGGAAAQQSLGI